MYRVFYRSRTRSRHVPAGNASILSKTGSSLASNISRTESKTEFEITSIIIRQCLEKKKYDKIVEVLRELSTVHLLKCLESFPFNVLNQSVPDSFPIWETLLVKLCNSENGSVAAQVPYRACHQLALRIASILAYLEQHSNPELYFQCRRVLKKVYMHYPDILDHLMKENEHLSRALYTLTLHIPLGTDSTAVSLQQAIQDEVTATLIDLKDAVDHLEELPLQINSSAVKNGWHHSLTQRQIQERLYFNQCVLHSVSPCRRKDNLSQLREMLETRIQGDKDILSLFASLRQRYEMISDSEPVEPRLRQNHHSVECAIVILREIQRELAINSPCSSPVRGYLREDGCVSPDNIDRQVNQYPLSAVSLDHTQFTEIAQEKTMSGHRSSSEKQLRIRPISASIVTSPLQCSTIDKNTSSSDQDISTPTAVPLNPAIAGMKKKGSFLRRSLRGSMKRLSSSTGNMSSSKSKIPGGNDEEAVLEVTRKQLLEAREQVALLRHRERELTDRLSEQAQRHLQGSEHFEDILMGTNRPSLVVQRFQEIYSQERVEAYEAIVDIDGAEENLFIPAFLLDILKFSYNAALCSLNSLHIGWKRALCVNPTDDRAMNALKQLELAVSVYIRKVPRSTNEIHEMTKMVYWDLEKSYGTLFFYRQMIDSVQSYIDECTAVAWDLVIQNPPMVLKSNETVYSADLHNRFHSANKSSDTILYYQWPTLVHENSGVVLSKGIVVT